MASEMHRAALRMVQEYYDSCLRSRAAPLTFAMNSSERRGLPTWPRMSDTRQSRALAATSGSASSPRAAARDSADWAAHMARLTAPGRGLTPTALACAAQVAQHTPPRLGSSTTPRPSISRLPQPTQRSRTGANPTAASSASSNARKSDTLAPALVELAIQLKDQLEDPRIRGFDGRELPHQLGAVAGVGVARHIPGQITVSSDQLGRGQGPELGFAARRELDAREGKEPQARAKALARLARRARQRRDAASVTSIERDDEVGIAIGHGAKHDGLGCERLSGHGASARPRLAQPERPARSPAGALCMATGQSDEAAGTGESGDMSDGGLDWVTPSPV